MRLSETARRNPTGVAVVEPLGHDRQGKRQYRQVSFGELDEDTDRIAAGLQAMGVEKGTRLALMVRPGIDFIALVFALFKSGAVTILIDPGMGRKNLLNCLQDAQPQGFVAISFAQAIRCLLPHRFRKARFNVTVGRRWFWTGPTLAGLRRQERATYPGVTTTSSDSAAIIFTTGSTGPPKGVLYRHGNFDRQVDEIRDAYDIQPGEIDLPGFPLFALFNAAMGVTTVIPDMDFTRPADVDPRNIVEAVRDWQVTQAFGSPALLNTVGRYCETHEVKLPTLRRVLSAGAPVPPHVLRRVQALMASDGEIHTPYGATEALPVATISASEVLGETAQRSEEGAGTCVGHRFPGIQWKVIRIRDDAIAKIEDIEEIPNGQIGELMVTGPVVTSQYVTQCDANPLHKVPAGNHQDHGDGGQIWHRMGDVGYLDEQGRFWFCGRKAHRVETESGTLYTIPCEAIVNCHPHVYRSAVVGVGSPPQQTPVMVVETWPEHRAATEADRLELIRTIRQRMTASEITDTIEHVLLHDSLPVDIRHNAKIFREQLAVWATDQLRAAR
jgi:acyl-CoA synthetase (AMP-forming)/AMP-acid ligase II